MRFCEMALASCVPGAAALSPQERGLGLPLLPAVQGRGSRSPGGGDVQKQHLLALALPAPTACDGEKCSEGHCLPHTADPVVNYTRVRGWVFQKRAVSTLVLKLTQATR